MAFSVDMLDKVLGATFVVGGSGGLVAYSAPVQTALRNQCFTAHPLIASCRPGAFKVCSECAHAGDLLYQGPWVVAGIAALIFGVKLASSGL